MEVEELLQRIDIVEYASQFTDLEEKNGEWWGISPFTFPPEKTPSFSVRRESKSFYDFSSGIGGTVITLTQFMYNISKHEAIEKLKKSLGDTSSGYNPADRLAATAICKKFAKAPVREKEVKVSPIKGNYRDRYEDRPEKLQVWRDEGISDASMKKFQVMYDSFSDRIVYPIRNPDGQIVNVGGRTLDPLFKEHDQKKYCYFYPWGTLQTIYGFAENLQEIKKRHEIILFEGCKSVLKADTWGIYNTGAILTSHLNPAQMKLLAKLGCDVVFALDKDVDIRKDHNIEKLKQYVNVYYLNDSKGLLDAKDAPVDRGEEIFRMLYEGRKRYR